MQGDTTLDTIKIGDSIESHEGVDVSNASRIRVHYLASQSAVLVTQTQFADAKAAALMTLSGLLLFRGPAAIADEIHPGPLVVVSLLLNLACLATCVFVLMPRTRPRSNSAGLYGNERFSWLSLSLPDTADNEETYADFMRTAQVSHLIISQARANQASAQVLRQKFVTLRLAILFGAASIATIAAEWALIALQP